MIDFPDGHVMMKTTLFVLMTLMTLTMSTAAPFPGFMPFSPSVIPFTPPVSLSGFKFPVKQYASTTTGLLHPQGLVVGFYSNVTFFPYASPSTPTQATTASIVSRRGITPSGSMLGGAPSTAIGCKNNYQCFASYAFSSSLAMGKEMAMGDDSVRLVDQWGVPFPDGPGFTSWSVYKLRPEVDPDHAYIIGSTDIVKVSLADGSVVGKTSGDYISFSTAMLCGSQSPSQSAFAVVYGQSNSLALQTFVADVSGAGGISGYTPAIYGYVNGGPSLSCGSSSRVYASLTGSSPSSPAYMLAYDMETKETVWKSTFDDVPFHTPNLVGVNSVVTQADGSDTVITYAYARSSTETYFVGIDGATGNTTWSTPMPSDFHVASAFINTPSSSILFVGSNNAGSHLSVLELDYTDGSVMGAYEFEDPNVATVQNVYGEDGEYFAIFVSGFGGAGYLGVTSLTPSK